MSGLVAPNGKIRELCHFSCEAPHCTMKGFLQKSDPESHISILKKLLQWLFKVKC